MADHAAVLIYPTTAVDPYVGVSDSSPATVLNLGVGGIVTYFKMRGVDNGAGYVTWIVTGSPDPDGTQAAGNATPPLVGSVVAGSGVVVGMWQV